MAIKKSELYTSLWASCDELRGGMDASQYKDYVLVMLFIKYISDKYAGVPFAPITVPKGSSFNDMVALKGKPTIGDDINKKIIGPIVKANNNLDGTINVTDFNNSDKLGSGKEMIEKLTNLILIFENPELDFSKNKVEGDDILGDAYEYLMRHFATDSGKSKGQFYTPAEVSRVISKIIGINSKNSNPSTTVYDPTCGSGSLLLKVANESERNITLYGQENDVSTAALARMNMILHNYPGADIKQGNTLANPLFLNENSSLKTFDYVVANPPFSYKSWSNGVNAVNDSYRRFQDYGIPPTKNGDYAFLLHIIRSLKSRGKGAVILPHGVLFRGNSEAHIREILIRKGFIKGIIGLPSNLFYGTGIPACIIVLDKENSESRKGIFIVDASKGFMKDGNKNRLREQDIHKIVDVFNKQIEIKGFSAIVSLSKIEENEFNLNIPRYIDNQDIEDIQDIEAHLLGDIPNFDIDALNAYWEVYPSLKNELFAKSKRKNYSKLKIAEEDIKQKIFSHPEFTAYNNKINSVFTKWKNKSSEILKDMSKGIKPKKLIYELGEDLLNHFKGLSLLDKYDVYQHLLTYWMETMQDDVYDIAADGWKAGNEIEWDEKKKTFEGRLIPKNLIINRYFEKEQRAIEELESTLEEYKSQLEEIVEEYGGEEGLLNEVTSDSGKVSKNSVVKRIKELEQEKKEKYPLLAADAVGKKSEMAEELMQEQENELSILKKYLEKLEKIEWLNKKLKELYAELYDKIREKYKILKINEIKDIVVDDKWMATLYNDVQSEMQRISQKLTQRIIELTERYESPLSDLNNEIKELEKKVCSHLNKMGFEWNY
jgi:type I restriction enzyme M protein